MMSSLRNFAASLKQGSLGVVDPDDGGADAKTISDEDIGFQEACGGEVLAKRSPGAGGIEKFGLPWTVMFGGIGVDGFVGATVNG